MTEPAPPEATPHEVAIAAALAPAPPPPAPSPWREAGRWIAMLVLGIVLPMLLLGATVAPHVDGCGGG